MSAGQLILVWALLALAVMGIPGYAIGWWNGRRLLRRALDAAALPFVTDLEVRVVSIDPLARRVSITCPRCGRISYHPEDVAQGYCGACHAWTSPRVRISEDPYPTTPLSLWGPHQAQLDATEREIRQMTEAAEERDPYRRRR